MRTAGITIPSSPAIWRRIAETRRRRFPPEEPSTSGTSPKPLQRLLGVLSVPGLARPPGLCGCGEGERRLGGVLLAGQAVAHAPADRGEDPGDREERQLGQAGDEREQPDHGRRDQRGFALAQDLGGDVRAEVFLGGGAGDDDAGGDGDQQRGDLGGEAVPDGQQRELVGRFGEGQPALCHAHDDATDEVDRGDDQRRHRVAFDELRGAVHRAVEVRFAGDLRAAVAGLLVGDQPCVQVGVDRHLLAGHRVEGEARADLGDAPGAVGDDNELDHDEDQEDYEADDDVAGDDERPERLHHRAGVPGGEDQACDRHVDREAEHRGEQQQRGEGGEVQGLAEVHRGDHDCQRAGDVERDQQVQQRGGQRDDEHRHDHHHRDGGEQVGVAQQTADGVEVHARASIQSALLIV
jgi:hypothetical protein